MSIDDRSLRARFSLLNLVFLLTATGFGFGLYRAKQRNIELQRSFAPLRAELDAVQAENARMREENGYLTIDKPEDYHAIALDSLAERTWSYRVYLPPGREYWVQCKINDLPTGGDELAPGGPPGLNTIASTRGGQAIGLPPGEYVVTFLLHRTEDGGWAYKLNAASSLQKASGGHKDDTGGAPLTDQSLWPYTESRGHGRAGVRRETTVQPVTRPLQLLELRVLTEQVTSTADATQGVIVWVHSEER